ncbi:Uncharacterised protein [Legionella israelensis]|nr:hypothetical protein SAMN02746069_02978 [Legionella israelensis DSM 19235]STX60089.1 Uncharacterised protein [Legionella israelensis]
MQAKAQKWLLLTLLKEYLTNHQVLLIFQVLALSFPLFSIEEYDWP